MKWARHFFSGLILTFVATTGLYATETEKSAEQAATHKQIELFKPTRSGRAISLHTFCMDAQANILACTSDDKKHFLQVYSPERKLIRETPLTFGATAVSVTKDGTIFVAGDGHMAKISPAGEVIETKDTPNIGDRDSIKERLEKAGQEQLKQYSESMQTQIDSIQERIDKITAKASEDLSERDRKRLKTLETQKQTYEESIKSYKEYFANPEQLLQNAFSVTAMAVNSKSVYLACDSIDGQGYEVWRMNHDFSEPEKLLSDLGGCCGQFDIQVDEQNLILAENTKFKVGLLDLDGKRVSDFGQSNRMGGNGFGSCCNPMNVRCCSNGDILTAESSIGWIKRYDREGNLQAIVGKAKIGGGCKHVPIGYDAERDRYYMMYQDRNAICVLVPLSEAPEFTAEELLAKEAREGLGKKLVGNWSVDGKRPAPFQPPQAANSEDDEEVLLVVSSEDDPFLSKLMEFAEDGKLKTHQTETNWQCIRQEGEVLIIGLDLHGTIYEIKVEFDGSEQVTLSPMVGNQVYSTKKYVRIVESESAESPAKSGGGE